MGTHLVTPRRGFAHHGIYVGGGRVVHYGALAHYLHRRPVEEVSLARFTHGHPVWVRPGESSRFDCEEVIRRARSRVGEDCYRLLSNNCEHFCEWCLHGQHRSYQVEELYSRVRRISRSVSSPLRTTRIPRMKLPMTLAVMTTLAQRSKEMIMTHRALTCLMLLGIQPATADTGWYTQAQAHKGHQLFNNYCAQCHRPDLTGAAGPALVGKSFLASWSSKPVGDLYTFEHDKMPATNPGSLQPDVMWTITAYILQKNGFAAGNTALGDNASSKVLASK